MSDAARMADDFGLDASPNFRIEGDAYVSVFPLAGVTVEMTRLEPARSEVFGLIRVTGDAQGLPRMIHQGRFNLTSTSARSTLVRYLSGRADIGDWAEVIEVVCHQVLEAIRQGQPVVRLSEVQPRQHPPFRAGPLVVEGFPTIIFGPGGSGKSLLGMVIAMAVHGEGWELVNLNVVPGQVMICDWELDDVTYKEGVERLARGFGIPMPDLHYRQCSAPLAEEASSIGRDIARLGINLVIIDSLGYAIGGDKTSQELTMRMFAAIRSWKTTVLCIDHITNDETTGNRPYGSVYTTNSARSLWRVKSEQEDGSNELSMGLFQTKANFGKQPPVGFRVTFEDDATFVERADIRDMPAMRDNFSASMKIKTALTEARESLTKSEIAEVTGLREDIVRARLGDLLRRGDVTRIDAGPGARLAAKWALRSAREEPI